MQRSEIDTEIGALLGDPSHDRWPLDIIHTREGIAEEQVCIITNCLKKQQSLTPTADVNYVDIGSWDVITGIFRAWWIKPDNEIVLLTGISLEDLDFYNPNWRNLDSALPTHYALNASERRIYLLPPPSSDYISALCFRAYTAYQPTVMSADISIPFEATTLLYPYHMSIVHWVVAQCWMDDGSPEALAKARFHRSNNMDNPGEFEKIIKQINAKFNVDPSAGTQIKWQPQGGRLGGLQSSKSYPFA